MWTVSWFSPRLAILVPLVGEELNLLIHHPLLEMLHPPRRRSRDLGTGPRQAAETAVSCCRRISAVRGCGRASSGPIPNPERIESRIAPRRSEASCIDATRSPCTHPAAGERMSWTRASKIYSLRSRRPWVERFSPRLSFTTPPARMAPMRILIAGSRHWHDLDLAERVLNRTIARYGPSIHGPRGPKPERG